MSNNYNTTPDDLPIPLDDGAAKHLIGMTLPSVSLMSTHASMVDVSSFHGWLVIYCYPMTGVPGVPLPPGWNDIPGARGCTPQSNAYKQAHPALKALGARIFGLSTQDVHYQQEMAERLQLPFAVLSDKHLHFQKALHLPTFGLEGKIFLKRLTIVARQGVIKTVHYPIFPSVGDAAWVLNYLESVP
jgi:peroxiredoxin